jgi:hypothetical protein
MGYWKQSANGESLQLEGDLIWGDQPADILDAALKEIIAVFKRDRERAPTADEIKAGLLFSLRIALRE